MRADWRGRGRTCHVEQGQYGHRARKATWLYAVAPAAALPELRWGRSPADAVTALVGWCANHVSHGEHRQRISKRAAEATPPEFRDVLLGIARAAGSRRTYEAS